MLLGLVNGDAKAAATVASIGGGFLAIPVPLIHAHRIFLLDGFNGPIQRALDYGIRGFRGAAFAYIGNGFLEELHVAIDIALVTRGLDSGTAVGPFLFLNSFLHRPGWVAHGVILMDQSFHYAPARVVWSSRAA